MFKLLPPHKQKLVNYYLRRVHSEEPLRNEPTLQQKAKSFLRDFEKEVKLNMSDDDYLKTNISNDKLKMRINREREIKNYNEFNDMVLDKTLEKIKNSKAKESK